MTARRTGEALLGGASLIGGLVALFAYLRRGSGVDHTGGALLVVVSSALLVLAAIVLALSGPSWLRILFLVLAILGVVGTGVAAWFLHEWLLLALMVVALIGWAILVAGRGEAARTAGAAS
jgi:hypothetical protein